MPTSRWLLPILGLALALRLGAAVMFADRPLTGDAITYDSIALNLAGGHGYSSGDADTGWRPTAMRGPSYVLLLAGFYRIAGHRLIWPLAAQAFLEALSCWAVYRLTSKWFGREGPALLAATMFAIYPPFVLQSAQVLTETFTTTTLLLTILAFFAYVERRNARDLVLAGLALGTCALNKPQIGPVGFVLAFAALPVLGWRGALRAAVAITAVVAVLMTPWMIRNARVFHAFVPGVTLGGISFWGGTAPFQGRMVGGLADPWVPDSLRRALERMDELQASNWLFRDGLRVIAEDPARYARVTVRKFFQLWFNLGYDDPASRASLLLALAHVGAMALAWFAIRRARPDPVATRTLWAMGLFWTAVYVPFCTVVRYAMPYLAVLFCFTAAGVFEWLPRGRVTRAVDAAPR